MIRLPTEDEKEIELDKLDAEVFTSLSEARENMIERATEQIDLILEKAKEISSVFAEFENAEDGTDLPDLDSSAVAVENGDTEYATVDLGGGKVGRIDVNDINKLKEMAQ
jgi:vacuolar-type H+-ATPase subunit I/STV1